MYSIAALYHFTRFDDPSIIRQPILNICGENRISGTLLLAKEGINGTIAGPGDGIDKVLEYLRGLPGCANLDFKKSESASQPFSRLKVKIKKEIVTMGQSDVDPRACVGRYVDPRGWNEMINSPDVVAIDTRNDYEVAIGTFENSINPGTSSFREFPEWWRENGWKFQGKRVAMFCTGGIRCEKSTNYLISQGVSEVYHLKGGILKYLEEIPEEQSAWEGDCFVFDGRVSVAHGLEKGRYKICYACRHPILPEDMNRREFERGVSCHLCIANTSDSDKARFRERQRQIDLAKMRGESHIKSVIGRDSGI